MGLDIKEETHFSMEIDDGVATISFDDQGGATISLEDGDGGAITLNGLREELLELLERACDYCQHLELHDNGVED